MVMVHGYGAWLWCMVMVHMVHGLGAYGAWLRCMVIVHGYGAWLRCMVIMHGYGAWLWCMVEVDIIIPCSCFFFNVFILL